MHQIPESFCRVKFPECCLRGSMERKTIGKM